MVDGGVERQKNGHFREWGVSGISTIGTSGVEWLLRVHAKWDRRVLSEHVNAASSTWASLLVHRARSEFQSSLGLRVRPASMPAYQSLKTP
jgi:hypothetical protein